MTATDKLHGYKAGDRVRVTFEGEVSVVSDGVIAIVADGGQIGLSFDPAETSAPTFHIERIEKPLAVGDRVRGRALSLIDPPKSGVIVFSNGTHAWVRWEGAWLDHSKREQIYHVSNLERIP